MKSPETVPLASTYVRKETFLAHYPRSWKLTATGLFFAFFIGLSFVPVEKNQKIDLELPGQVADELATEVKPVEPAQEVKKRDVAPTDPVAAALNDNDDHQSRMATAPDPGLTEETVEGPLPRIGEDGRKPWQVYARPFNPNDTRPRIAIVMMEMGLSAVASDAALRRLPANVTMAFDSQSSVLGSWLNRARMDGHETLLSIPMEPFDFPRSDPGPNALLTNLPNSNIIQRFYSALRKGSGYVGITTLSGSRFTTDTTKVGVLLDVLKQRGLMAFDARVSPRSVLFDLAKQAKVPASTTTLNIDKDPTPAAIDAALRQLEQTAQLEGHAVGIATPLPLTLDHLESWIQQLPNHGFALAPITAVVE